jgi:UDP-N-acetylglucosamine--N-acetylmuramyl-(pentapeptide) pyrophosphoryl-undecaprenol N-acetylglucosamine transferase
MTVLQALGDKVQSVLWVGSRGGMEASLVERARLPFTTISAAGVHGVSMRSLPRNLLLLVCGWWQSLGILGKFHPNVLFFTGGYVAAPMAVAGSRIPILLFTPDIEPGMALKFLAGFADIIAVPADESLVFFKKHRRVVVTGYPTRPELSNWERSTARMKLFLSDDLPVLLFAGGSKGAHSINLAAMNALPELLQFCQVVHITGNLDWEEVETFRSAFIHENKGRYHAFPYMHEEMGAALAAADLVVSRAGASILGEYPLFGLPAVLVPYPHAWRYQKVNAAHLASRGAAITLEDGDLQSQLLPTVKELLHNPARLLAMRRAMAALATPLAADKIAALALELGGAA